MSSNIVEGTKRIVVAGMGRQGWAIIRQILKIQSEFPDFELYVYDFPNVEERLLTDEVLRKQPRIQRLRNISSEPLDAIKTLKPDLLINAATFKMHQAYTRAAFEADCDYIDLGQNTWQALRQRNLQHKIRETGRRMRLVPECGLAPGLVNILSTWLSKPEDDSIQIRVGGLPIDTDKGGSLHYAISWSLAGLIQEYEDVTMARKNEKLVSIKGLSSDKDREDSSRNSRGTEDFIVRNKNVVERLKAHMLPVKSGERFLRQAANGEWCVCDLEAQPTSDGISLMPFDERFDYIKNLEYKTLRYRGHFKQIANMVEAGTIETDLKDALKDSPLPDMVLLRVWTEREGEVQSKVEGLVLSDIELEQRDDDRDMESTMDPFFSAMQHLTGWPTVLSAKTLLTTSNLAEARPPLVRDNLELWSGQFLDDALNNGGVIMPYELLDGGRLLSILDSGQLIPHRDFASSIAG